MLHSFRCLQVMDDDALLRLHRSNFQDAGSAVDTVTCDVRNELMCVAIHTEHQL
jgi:hypothetical protein